MAEKKQIPVLYIGIGIAGLIIIAALAYLMWPSGENDTTTDDQGISLLGGNIAGLTKNEKGELMNSTHTATKIGDKYVLIANAPITPTAPVQDQTSLPVTVDENLVGTSDERKNIIINGGVPAGESEAKKTEGKVIKLSVFEDWVSSDLTIQDTEIGEFTVFEDKTAVEDFVKQYSWNERFDFQWNCEVLGIDIANDYGESDPAPAVFGTTGKNGNLYFVALSSDEITPQFYQLDQNKDSKPEVIEKKSGKKSVLAVDDWSTDAL